ncbi:hypothetical protein DERP_003100 [Dermatophagoides pteronyssinus]|uniref:Uncharacterized protein n=1 Tax=Dermatophagoides pteronyssinus TaxID=6956 RepID=A0ABQ8JIK4_DERPT|nr:hypothetical protein DERP_003100 [Dermatophagoides pteronyssinus]
MTQCNSVLERVKFFLKKIPTSYCTFSTENPVASRTDGDDNNNENFQVNKRLRRRQHIIPISMLLDQVFFKAAKLNKQQQHK